VVVCVPPECLRLEFDPRKAPCDRRRAVPS